MFDVNPRCNPQKGYFCVWGTTDAYTNCTMFRMAVCSGLVTLKVNIVKRLNKQTNYKKKKRLYL
jgi:hypothetical protein